MTPLRNVCLVAVSDKNRRWQRKVRPEVPDLPKSQHRLRQRWRKAGRHEGEIPDCYGSNSV